MALKKDAFERVPEFLTAWNNILENGFFESIEFNTRGMGRGKSGGFCSIYTEGFVPNDAKNKKDGCGAIIDPKSIIDNCRELAGRREVKNIEVEIKSTDMGKKGKEVRAKICISFK